jgi:hypothetical protein
MRFGFRHGRGREHQHNRDRVGARPPTVPTPSASASRRESSLDRRRGLATDHPAVVGARRHPPGRLDRVRDERDVRERQHRDHPRAPRSPRSGTASCSSTCRCRGERARRGSRHRCSTTRTRWRSRRARGAAAAVGCLATVRGRDAACSCRTAPASGTMASREQASIAFQIMRAAAENPALRDEVTGRHLALRTERGGLLRVVSGRGDERTGRQTR